MCSSSPRAQTPLPVHPSSARLARRFLDEHWCHDHAGTALAAAQVVVSELVTNAVRHGGPPIALALDCDAGDGVVLAVSDGGRRLPEQVAALPDAVGGRGVHLVQLLSSEWGVRPHDGRGTKTVWSRVPLAQPSARPSA
ncbi:ATP-binding protein [Kineococcus sp. SYSU DK006]|uniref:ATP-binding protein n=1 Tax=Kineococcus sp. SYSU DK006 TaxID=3383127 RepID=UPI003D7CE08F